MMRDEYRKALFAEIRQAYNNQNVIRLVQISAVFSRADDTFANEYIVPQLLDYIVALDDTRHRRLAISDMKHYNRGQQDTVNRWANAEA